MRFLVILGLLATADCWFSRRRSGAGTTSYGAKDLPCQRMKGKCQYVSKHCAGDYLSGKCGGPSTRKCCADRRDQGRDNVGGHCTLVSYSASQIKGYQGLNVRVHQDFKKYMDMMNRYAKECKVTVWVTNAFRKTAQSLHGTVVPPAQKSNHLVGHAIDFNLDTPKRWCNSRCLQAGSNSYAQCFIKKVTASGLRWGGNFRRVDPVHIDDGLNVHSVSRWNKLYIELQKYC